VGVDDETDSGIMQGSTSEFVSGRALEDGRIILRSALKILTS
jgi:hypothetical protein